MAEKPDPQMQPMILTGRSESCEDDCACSERPVVLSSTGQSLSETDCACSDSATTLKAPDSAVALYCQTTDVYTLELLQDKFWLAFSPYAPDGPSVLNSAAWDRWRSFALPQPLSESADRTLAEEGLIQPLQMQPSLSWGEPETLTTWLHITNACNLDCPYCYVRKSSARMSEEVGLNAIERIFETARLHHFRGVKLKYAGGEATLHFQLVECLHERARHLADSQSLHLSEVVLSNGTHLSPRNADWLVENAVKLMISIDGVGHVHDNLRRRKGGGETFGTIERTVDQVLLPRGIRPDISVTITGVNASGVADAVRWALERDLPVSLNFYRRSALTASRTDLELEEQAIIDGMLEAYKVFETFIPERPFLSSLLDRVQFQAHAQTCSVGLSYIVVTHEGALAQCQMHLEHGIQAERGDWLEKIKSGPIQNLPVHQKAGCADCTYRYRCSGGCPIETYQATGRWDLQSPNCHIYQTLFPTALRLEGLRLLKVHGYLQ